MRMQPTAAMLGLLLCSQFVLAQSPQNPPSATAANATLEMNWTPPPANRDLLRISYAQLAPPGPTVLRESWRGFWAMTAAATGLAITDIELSQACLRQFTCTEANPLLPRSRAAAYAIQLPLTAAGTWFSYHLKKHHQKRWWLPQFGLVAGHAVGAASGARAAF